MANPLADPEPGMPRWVKISLIISGVLIVIVVILLLSGHGPGQHLSSEQVSSEGSL